MAVNINIRIVFSRLSELYPRDETIEEMLGEMFSMQPHSRLHN
jgi:hypothetical protein